MSLSAQVFARPMLCWARTERAVRRFTGAHVSVPVREVAPYDFSIPGVRSAALRRPPHANMKLYMVGEPGVEVGGAEDGGAE